MAQGHRTMKLTRMPWAYCVRCGLVYLKNAATAAAIRRLCAADED